MEKKDYIELVNNSTGPVSIVTQNGRVSFNAPSVRVPVVVQKVKRDQFIDMFNAPGVASLFLTETLLINDREMRDFLGLPELSEFTISFDQIPKLFTGDVSESELERILQYCSDTVLENIVVLASEVPNKDMAKNLLIKRYSGFDPYEIYSEKETTEPSGSSARTPLGEEPVSASTPRRVIRKEV